MWRRIATFLGTSCSSEQVGGACHMVQWRLFAVLLCHGHGWWWNGTRVQDPAPLGPWREWLRVKAPGLENTHHQAEGVASDVLEGFTTSDSSRWEFGLWWLCDATVGFLGWTVFGSAWNDVRSGCRRLLQLGGLLFLCLAAHYIWAVRYPVVTVMVALLAAVLWILRRFMRTIGTVMYHTQRWVGGAPEADDVEFWGPLTGKVPETTQLRQFKPPSSGERWIAVRQGSQKAVFRVGSEGQTIRSHGLYVQVDPDGVGGDPRLVAEIRNHDKVHLCRNLACGEEGAMHLQEYGLVKSFNPERFQYAQAETGACEATQHLWGWMRGSGKEVQRLAIKVREYASESEAENDWVMFCRCAVARFCFFPGDWTD